MTTGQKMAARTRDGWRPGGRGLPALRVLDRSGHYAPDIGSDGPAADPPGRPGWTYRDYGSPSTQWKLGGVPLEVRVWADRPPPGVKAVRHPAGVWLAIREI